MIHFGKLSLLTLSVVIAQFAFSQSQPAEQSNSSKMTWEEMSRIEIITTHAKDIPQFSNFGKEYDLIDIIIKTDETIKESTEMRIR